MTKMYSFISCDLLNASETKQKLSPLQDIVSNYPLDSDECTTCLSKNTDTPSSSSKEDRTQKPIMPLSKKKNKAKSPAKGKTRHTTKT
ncbi:unnamed protein product [Brassica rapa subsp. trilocularis]